ncbi:hypothetical protein F5Y15DRAFT_184147 [Xylariaceae sp. FL0016]|nr:hypothetical protein F5Y15DRAFT_184147 [Xylariaceae sp. FL0016]
MMATATGSLSRRDLNVLEKIKDPEYTPLMGVTVDPNLPKDPNVTDSSTYEHVARKEREIVHLLQQLEMRLASLNSTATAKLIQDYRERVQDFGDLISEYPKYASVRNNRAQALRRLFGDKMLLPGIQDPAALIPDASDIERTQAADTTLSDLDEAIKLLTPQNTVAPISIQAGKTLSLAHTQRAAIFHMTAKVMQPESVILGSKRKEASWSKIDFETAASRDFSLGGRYGNDIAKGLAVNTNPTAKLCGEMVREAMKKEYGPEFAV